MPVTASDKIKDDINKCYRDIFNQALNKILIV